MRLAVVAGVLAQLAAKMGGRALQTSIKKPALGLETLFFALQQAKRRAEKS